ncbi:MAG TPA: restriction endonuclease [Syntrophomonas sp.]|nr:restriction endonuclease [Syntrophomonas sp.]
MICPVTVWNEPLSGCEFIIERKQELEHLRSYLFHNSPAIASIKGPYGAGKTFFAKQYAEEYDSLYPGGIHYFDHPVSAQTFWEQRIDGIQDPFPQLTLCIVDETDSALESDSPYGNIQRFDARLKKSKQQDNLHILLIGNRTPDILNPDGYHFNLDSLTSQQAQEIIHQFIRQHKEEISPYVWPEIIKKADGNIRALYSMLYLLEDHHVTSGTDIIVQEGLCDVLGRPLQKSDKQFTRMQIEVFEINKQVMRDLKNNPRLLHALTPRQFEQLVADLLGKMGYEVHLTPQTRDGGKDIYAAKKSEMGSFLYLVECKKHEPEHPVGINVIRQLYGVLQQERATYAMVATTSYYSGKAIQFQKEIEHQMSLKDYQDLVRWLREYS